MHELIFLALATSAISVTITRSGVFAKQRSWLLEKNLWLGRLVSCPYCLSHWVSAVLVGMYQPVVVSLWIGVDLLVSVFIVVALSAFRCVKLRVFF